MRKYEAKEGTIARLVHGAEMDRAGYGVDSNRAKATERAYARLVAEDQDVTDDIALERAIELAEQTVATARECALQISALRSGPTYCYLALFGLGDESHYLKVGMSRHPEKRVYDFATGNPLDLRMLFTAELPTAKRAYAVEQRILRHLEAWKRRGEWIDIGRTDREQAIALARSLTAVAAEVEPLAGDFVLAREAA